MLDAARGHIAGVQLVAGSLVIAFLVGHRADQREPVEDRSGAVPVLSQLHSGNRRRDGLGGTTVCGTRLGVECLELALASGHPQQDHRSTLPLDFFGVDADDIRDPDRAGGQGGGGDGLENSASGEHAGRAGKVLSHGECAPAARRMMPGTGMSVVVGGMWRLSAREEFAGVDQAPHQVFECFATLAHLGDVVAADAQFRCRGFS